MVGSSKILTVSYGTFSCTLEGFDESFDTMRSIAEYFRDLAADDRYFGAEPPTPDADMLARIAEKEIARRVEARTDASGIVLRATGALGVSNETTVARAKARTAMPPQPVRPAELPAQTERFDEFEDQVTSDEATADVSGSAPEPVTEDAQPAPSSLLAESGSVAEEYVEEDDAWADMTPPTISEAPAHPDSESVAAKLQRIRAVVGRTETSEAQADDETADLVANEESEEFFAAADDTDGDGISDAFEDAFEQQTAEVEVSDSPETLDETVDEADEAFEDESDLADFEEDDTFEEDASFDTDDSFEDDEDEIFEEAAASPIDDAVAAIEGVEVEEFDTDEDLADDDDDASMLSSVLASRAAAETHEVVEDDVTELFDEAIETLDEDHVADIDVDDEDDDEEVVREDVSSTDFAALDGLEELEAFSNAPHGILSDEDEASLQAELEEASKETDFADEDVAEADEDLEEIAEDAPVQPRRVQHDFLNNEPEADEAAMSRILSQTDAELDEPEGRNRRNAIAQLKAAVAATEAARQLGDDSDGSSEAEKSYREDLSQAVRPARPVAVASQENTRRTERPRAAPLRLVASQRVDVADQPAEAPEAAVAVRPRRIAVNDAPAPSPSDDVESFADFAKRSGATNLSELLEAAAAFTSFVEGLEDFSRPQIMNKVREVAPEEYDREAGLRSFGTLLREGRISKVRNGRFQVAQSTRYNPERRAARG